MANDTDKKDGDGNLTRELLGHLDRELRAEREPVVDLFSALPEQLVDDFLSGDSAKASQAKKELEALTRGNPELTEAWAVLNSAVDDDEPAVPTPQVGRPLFPVLGFIKPEDDDPQAAWDHTVQAIKTYRAWQRRWQVWWPIAVAASVAAIFARQRQVRWPIVVAASVAAISLSAVGIAIYSRPQVIKIQDGMNSVAFDTKKGTLSGLPNLSEERRRQVRNVLLAQRVEPTTVSPPGERWRSRGGPQTSPLIDPVRTRVASDRPSFRWNALPGAASYTVEVRDEEDKLVQQSAALAETEWTPSDALARGATFSWRVTAAVGDREMVAPEEDDAPAWFTVIDGAQLEELERARKECAGSHLALGSLYAKVGLLGDAERELEALAAENPESPVARKILESLRNYRRDMP
jgi:hypothetical protein